MQHLSIPNDVLLRLEPYFSSLFPNSDHEINPDVQYLSRELVAAAKCASMEEVSSCLPAVLSNVPSNSSSPYWSSSATAVDSFSRAGSLGALDFDTELNLPESLPPSSPPIYPSSSPQYSSLPLQTPSNHRNNLTTGTDDVGESCRRGTKRTRSASDTVGGSVHNNGDGREKRAALQAEARERDEDRVRAAQAARVMGHNWTPDCSRAGGRVLGPGEVIARELHHGIPMIHGPGGPELDPSVSTDNGYAPGVGGGSGEIVEGREAEDDCEEDFAPSSKPKAKSTRKTSSKQINWQTSVQKARLKEDTVPLLSLLSDVSTIERQIDVCDFAELVCRTSSVSGSNVTPTHNLDAQAPSLIAQTVSELARLRSDSRVLSFHSMIQAMQLSILVDIELKKLKKGTQGVRQVWAAAKTAFTYETFRVHQVAGFRLLELASGCSIYIIFIIAALGVRKQFVNATVSQITAIAKAFRVPPSEGPWSTVIKQVIIPRLRFLQLRKVPAAFVNTLLWRPSETSEGNLEYLQLSELLASDNAFGKIKMNDFTLPERSSIAWSLIPPSTLPTFPTLTQSPYIVEAVTVTAPWISENTPCPVRRANRDEWTEVERQKAEDRMIATDLNDLQTLLNEQVPPNFQGGKPSTSNFQKKFPYIGIPSTIISGQTLKVNDLQGDLIAMVSTHAATVLKDQCEAVMSQLQIAFHDELFEVDTAADPFFQFFAMHFTWYNRYCETGEGAPTDIHPDQLIKEGAVKANFSQRTPRESEDIRKHPALYHQITALLRDILEFIRCNIEYHLPEMYKELDIHCEFLPLHDEAPARPFTSMVINLCACTKGHRDQGDKILCTTFTIGQCEGGEICLHEAGLVFDSRPGDMIVFLSQKETHFNLHMKGIRSTVVLHSDRRMDSWTGENGSEGYDPPYNRWDSHVY